MAYHDDLLRHAIDLVQKNPANPAQADLRRSVSAAYYALFHLLISDAVGNWSHLESRPALSRMFEHAAMAKASDRILNSKLSPFVGQDTASVERLRTVAKTFTQLQDKRHIADYDNETYWTQTEARKGVTEAETAFRAWHAIRDRKIAQDYLVSLLIRRRT